MKKLGFGLMRLPLTDPGDAANVDMEQLKQMVDLFMARGFTYFDTAIMYNNFASQRAAKAALVDRYPREVKPSAPLDAALERVSKMPEAHFRHFCLHFCADFP